MSYCPAQLKRASAIFLIMATGPAVAQAAQSSKSHVAGTARIPTDTPATVSLQTSPCPQKSAPVQGYRNFLVVNRTNATLACRMRHPTVGGWSPFVTVPPAGRLIDRQIDLDEIHVQCRPPVKPFAVRVFPGSRYALRQRPGSPEIALLKSVPQ